MIINNVCDRCRSDRARYICHCGQMRCSCEQGTCPTCDQQQEYENQQQSMQQEQAEREDFEDRMQEKYRPY